MSSHPTRRGFLLGAQAAALLALAGCATRTMSVAEPELTSVDPLYIDMYGDVADDAFVVPGFDPRRVEPQLLRQVVDYPTSERPGTIVVDPGARFLYFIQEAGQAMRYGVGVGREGYDYEGRAAVGRKARWPRWTPTKTMIEENPEVNAPWANGMEGGLSNPLGARALYLFKDGRDTLYRIHGTNDPTSIGRSVSSGCVRMFNQDVMDLYQRVPVGSEVVVLASQLPAAGDL